MASPGPSEGAVTTGEARGDGCAGAGGGVGAGGGGGAGSATRVHVGLQHLLRVLSKLVSEEQFKELVTVLHQVRAKQKQQQEQDGTAPDKRIFAKVIAKMLGVDVLKQGMRDAHIADAAALCKFFSWLEAEVHCRYYI